MKILIVSFNFPPYNKIGGIRVGKLAKYFEKFGHDVRVLTATKQTLHADLKVEIDKSKVYYTNWIDFKSLRLLVAEKKDVDGKQEYKNLPILKSIPKQSIAAKIKRKGGSIIDKWLIPDIYVGWKKYAIAAGRNIIEDFQPDIIYSSSRPLTSHLVASQLAQLYNTTWIAELRDPWFGNHAFNYTHLRRLIDLFQEKNTLKHAKALVTVTETWKLELSKRYPEKPVLKVMNGYDFDDYNSNINGVKNNTLTIAYTGNIYEGYQNILPFFNVLKKNKYLQSNILFKYFGNASEKMSKIVDNMELHQCCEIFPKTDIKEIINQQVSSDILLLLNWNDVKQKGVIPAKFFEYVGAKKPILCIGDIENELSQIIKENQLGMVTNSETAIEIYLLHSLSNINNQWMQNLDHNKFTREFQFRILNDFIINNFKS